MAKGKNGKNGKDGKDGKGSPAGKGKGKGDAAAEKTEANPNARLSTKSYKAAIDDVVKSTKVRPTDLDIKAVHLLDYLQRHGGRASEAIKFLKQAADGVERDDILSWRAYVYTLLRKFDENAYREMKASSGTDKGTRSARAAAPAADAAAAAEAPPLSARAQGGDASTRMPPVHPPLQDYLAQAGFFNGPPAPPAAPPGARGPPPLEPELNTNAPEFVPGNHWQGSVLGATPQGMLAAYPPAVYGYPGGYPGGFVPPSPYAAAYPGGFAPPPLVPPSPVGAGMAMPPVPPSPPGGKKGGRRGERSNKKGGKDWPAEGKGSPAKEGKGTAAEKKGSEEKSDAAAAAAEGAGGGAEAPAEGGAPPMWSTGSALHEMMQCKPCAFYHTKGCSSGAQCQFCHMCGPGEKKKRKKEAGSSKQSDQPDKK